MAFHIIAGFALQLELQGFGFCQEEFLFKASGDEGQCY